MQVCRAHSPLETIIVALGKAIQAQDPCRGLDLDKMNFDAPEFF
jgi:hypothetical protein